MRGWVSAWFLAAGIFAITLGLLLILAPGAYLSLYAAEYAPQMDFAARRFGAPVIGLGAVLLLARRHPSGGIGPGLALVSAGVFLGVAGTGAWSWSQGLANGNILVAAASEVLVAAIFLAAWVRLRA